MKITSAILVVVMVMLSLTSCKQPTIIDTFELMAVDINSEMSGEISGGLFGFSGFIEGKEYYFLTRINPNGSFERVRIPAQGTEIFYTSDTPKYIHTQYYSVKYTMYENTYVLYIPEGSIYSEYKVQ